MKKKVIIVSIILIIILIIGGIIINNYKKDYQKSKIEITISVFDKENLNIYNKNVETEETYLIDVLKNSKNIYDIIL